MSVANVVTLFTGKYAGRDKFAKCIQQGLRMYVAFLGASNPDAKEMIQRYTKLFKTLGTARKGMRLGKSLESYKKFLTVFGGKMSGATLAMGLVAEVCMIFRWALDNLNFLVKAKFLTANDYGVLSNKFRSVASVSYIVLSAQKLLAHNAKIDALRAEGGEKAYATIKTVQAARYEELLVCIARFCDLKNATHSSKLYVTGLGLDAMAGFTSSFINLRKVWIKIK